MAPKGIVRRRDIGDVFSLDDLDELQIPQEEISRVTKELERAKIVEICLYNIANFKDKPFSFCRDCVPLSPQCALCPYRKAINVKEVGGYYIIAANQREQAPVMRRGNQNYFLDGRKLVSN